MDVRCFENFDDLASARPQWDALAGDCPMRCWTWLRSWWRHYGEADAERRLAVFAVYDEAADAPASPLAVLPCYLESSWTQGRVLRLLGDGEVCSDHLGLLVDPARGAESIEALAAHLAERGDWDLLDFPAIDACDESTHGLVDALGQRGGSATRLPDEPYWVIDLPPTWDDFLAAQSKSHRKQLRQAERRVLESDRCQWRLVDDAAELPAAWDALIDLHQRRRQSMGEPGCFASPRWAAFHREVAAQLHAEGRLRLSTLTLDGTPAAAEYHLAGARATYAYQGGLDPDRLADEPGRLSLISTIQQAIAEGHAAFDLLRGDEPYKAHWRAAPRETFRLMATPPRRWARWRAQTWLGVRAARRMARQLTAAFG